jgi:hypothetical protein
MLFSVTPVNGETKKKTTAGLSATIRIAARLEVPTATALSL